MNITNRLKAIDAELDILYHSPINEANESRIEELEEEYRSIVLDLDSRIF